MLLFHPVYEDRYYIVTIKGDISPEDGKGMIRDMLAFADKIKYARFGAVTDMREAGSMTSEAQQILTDGMTISLKIGFTCAARIFHEITDEMVKKLRESNLKAGFIARYFTDIDKAVEYVKRSLGKFSNDPVITQAHLAEYLTANYPQYHL